MFQPILKSLPVPPIPSIPPAKVLNTMAIIGRFAVRYKLMVTGANVKDHWVKLSGPVKAFEKAFNTEIVEVEHAGEVFRINSQEIHIDDALEDLIESVSGITKVPFVKKPGMALLEGLNKISGSGGDTPASNVPEGEEKTEKEGWSSMWPQEWAEIYNFPPHLDGTGSTIAILAMGGGYEDKYLQQYFETIGIKMPEITWKKVTDAAENKPTPKPADGGVWLDYEVYMDIEIAAALAPGAKIVVYFTEDQCPNEFALAMKAIMADDEDDIDIVSISYGCLEYLMLGSEKRTLERTLKLAAAKGITVCASSGDYGSGGGSDWSLVNAQVPASSPYVLSVGGTRIFNADYVDNDHEVLNEKIEYEGNEHHIKTGGAFSGYNKLPSYQESIVSDYIKAFKHDSYTPPASKRGYPDVGATASTNPGIYIQVAGEDQVGCGTSAAAPLWAALIARINQHIRSRNIGMKSIGLINSYLYSLAGTKAFSPQLDGNNGTFTAGAPWNPCTGLGIPNGVLIMHAIDKLIDAHLESSTDEGTASTESGQTDDQKQGSGSDSNKNQGAS